MNLRKTSNRIATAVTLTVASLGLAGVMVFGAAPAHAQQTTSVVCVQSHIVQRGETLNRIARMYNTSATILASINGISNANRIYTGQTLCVVNQTVSGGTRYVVQAGDRLGAIARRYGVDLTVLARVNGITDINRIYVGQVLTIPDFTIQA
jgi:LysM repeat protein